MRGQVSIEFVILFTALFVFFIMIAALLPGQLRQREDPKAVTQRSLEELKLYAIFASTTSQEYEATIAIPSYIGSETVELRIYPYPENMARYVQTLSGKVLSSEQMPNITAVTDDPTVTGSVIIRRVAGKLVVVT